MKHIIIIIISVFFSISIQAETLTTSGAWLGTFTKRALANEFSLWAETQVRYNFDLGGNAQILYRFGILNQMTENQELGLLYGFIQSGINKEHRYTLQHSQQYGSVGSFSISHRARLEGRFLEDFSEDTSRLRLLIKAKNTGDSDYKLVLWNEVFINLQDRDWTGGEVFERNRLFAGFATNFFESKIEFGYLNQYVPRETKDTFEHLFVLYFPL